MPLRTQILRIFSITRRFIWKHRAIKEARIAGPAGLNFEAIHASNFFGSNESRSGVGSELLSTKEVRNRLPDIFHDFNVRKVLDIPSGDWNWMKEVDLSGVRYIGADVVPTIISSNLSKYSKEDVKFVQLDARADQLPRVDLVICRDLLVHLRLHDCFRVLQNIHQSGSRLLLTTTFVGRRKNKELKTKGKNKELKTKGVWRPLNLEIPPFSLPTPILLVNEKCNEGNGNYGDKSLGLWKIEDLRAIGSAEMR